MWKGTLFSFENADCNSSMRWLNELSIHLFFALIYIDFAKISREENQVQKNITMIRLPLTSYEIHHQHLYDTAKTSREENLWCGWYLFLSIPHNCKDNVNHLVTWSYTIYSKRSSTFTMIDSCNITFIWPYLYIYFRKFLIFMH